MFIQVIAHNPGHQNRYRAKRKFSCGEKYRIEVIDRPEDFLDANGNGDMTRMNRAAVEQLKSDPHFSVLSDSETSSSISTELFEAVKAQAADLAGRLSRANVEIARLTIEVQTLTKQLADKEQAAGAESAPPAPMPEVPHVADHGHAHDHDKHPKKGK